MVANETRIEGANWDMTKGENWEDLMMTRRGFLRRMVVWVC